MIINPKNLLISFIYTTNDDLKITKHICSSNIINNKYKLTYNQMKTIQQIIYNFVSLHIIYLYSNKNAYR